MSTSRSPHSPWPFAWSRSEAPLSPRPLNPGIPTSLKPGAFRLFLAAVVLVSHSSRFDFGDWAVYTFFILSGYWIHTMWVRKYSRTRTPVRVFLASRALRILPVFWLANILSTAVQVAIDPTFLKPAAGEWSQSTAWASNVLLFGYAVLPHTQGAMHAAWSLDVEMQFYLVVPLVAFLLSRPGHGLAWRRVLVALCLVGFAFFFANTAPLSRNVGYYGLFFLIGIMSASGGRPPDRKVVWLSVGLFLVAAAACWVNPEWRHLAENSKHGASIADLHQKRVFQALLALASAPIALATVRLPSGESDRSLGEITYIVYLAQWPVMTLHSVFFGEVPPLARIPSILGAWCIVGVLSVAIFRYYDQPLERIRKSWVARQLRA
jgi:peptidoglycan/LPS O-acetylase OafA/YrhL